MKKQHQTLKEKSLVILAKIYVITTLLTFCGGIIGKIFNYDLFRMIGVLYFIIASILYTLIFKILNEDKIIITKTSSGFQNRVYYFTSTITMLILLIGITMFFL